MRDSPSTTRTAQLSQKLLQLQAQAAAFSVPNEFGARLSREGAVGLNATTSHDATKYYTALPANKLELWFALEAERFRVSSMGRYFAGRTYSRCCEMLPGSKVHRRSVDTHDELGVCWHPNAHAHVHMD